MYGLTERQFKVVKLIARGYTNKQIAGELYMHENTVVNHIINIFKVYHAQNRAAVVSIFVARFLEERLDGSGYIHRISKDDVDKLYEILGAKEKESVAI